MFSAMDVFDDSVSEKRTYSLAELEQPGEGGAAALQETAAKFAATTAPGSPERVAVDDAHEAEAGTGGGVDNAWASPGLNGDARNASTVKKRPRKADEEMPATNNTSRPLRKAAKDARTKFVPPPPEPTSSKKKRVAQKTVAQKVDVTGLCRGLPRGRCDRCPNCATKLTAKQQCVRSMARDVDDPNSTGALLSLVRETAIGITIGIVDRDDGDAVHECRITGYDNDGMIHTLRYLNDGEEINVQLYKKHVHVLCFTAQEEAAGAAPLLLAAPDAGPAVQTPHGKAHKQLQFPHVELGILTTAPPPSDSKALKKLMDSAKQNAAKLVAYQESCKGVVEAAKTAVNVATARLAQAQKDLEGAQQACETAEKEKAEGEQYMKRVELHLQRCMEDEEVAKLQGQVERQERAERAAAARKDELKARLLAMQRARDEGAATAMAIEHDAGAVQE